MAQEEQPPQQVGIQNNDGGDITIEHSQVHIAGRDLHIHYPQSNTSRHSEPVFFLPTNLPGWYVERTEAMNALQSALLGNQRTIGVIAAAAVHGLGGLGKTVLARAICEDQTVRSTFTGGILWATLGQQADCRRHQREWIAALDGDVTKASSLEAGKVELNRCLTDEKSPHFGKAFLLILDDAWDMRDTEPLMFGNERCRVLITTRDVAQVEGTALISLELMSQKESRQLLQETSRGVLTNTTQIDAIAQRLGYLPLALQVVGSLLSRGISWEDIDSALQEGDLRFLSTSRRDVFSAIATSVHFLPPDKQERYHELAIFPRNEPLITSIVARFWHRTVGYKERDARKLLAEFRDRSLVQVDNRLHDLQYDYLLATTHQEERQRWHNSLVEVLRETMSFNAPLPDEQNYLLRYLISHLVQAQRVLDLEVTLTNVTYLQQKIALVGTDGLLEDFDVSSDNPLLRKIAGIIRLGSYILDKRPEELLNQITGRAGREFASQFHDISVIPKPRFPRFCLDSQTLTPSEGPLLRIFDHDDDRVFGCSFSPVGQLALSASSGGMYLWDIQTGRRLYHFYKHEYNVTGCTFSPNGLLALSCSADSTLKLWDVNVELESSSPKRRVGSTASGQCLRTFMGHEEGVLRCAFSPNGQNALSASFDHTMRLWDVQTGQCLHIFRGHQERVADCAFSPDGKYVLSASNDHTMRLWDIQTKQCLRVFKNFTDAVIRCVFSPDGHVVLSSSWGSLQLWEVQTEQLVRSFEGHRGWVRGCTFSQDGKQIFTTSDDGTLRVWDVQTGQCLRIFKGHSDTLYDCALSPDGQLALSVSGDHTMRLWDTHIEQAAFQHKVHTGPVVECAFSSDGQQVVSASFDGTLRLWNVQTQQAVQSFHGHTEWVRGCAFSPDNRWILSSSGDRTLRLWDTQTGQLVHTFEEHPDCVADCAFSPDGLSVLSACDDNILRLWNVQTKQLIRTFEGHTGSVASCTFSPDGKHILSAAFDGCIRFWDVLTGQSREFPNNINTRPGSVGQRSSVRYQMWSCALSPDGCLAVGTNNLVRNNTWIGNHYYNLRLWNVEAGKHLIFASWDEEMEHQELIYSCTFSTDGRFILSASADRKLRLWNVQDGNEVAYWTAESELLSCAFSPDGTCIVAGDSSGYLHFLSLFT